MPSSTCVLSNRIYGQKFGLLGRWDFTGKAPRDREFAKLVRDHLKQGFVDPYQTASGRFFVEEALILDGWTHISLMPDDYYIAVRGLLPKNVMAVLGGSLAKFPWVMSAEQINVFLYDKANNHPGLTTAMGSKRVTYVKHQSRHMWADNHKSNSPYSDTMNWLRSLG